MLLNYSDLSKLFPNTFYVIFSTINNLIFHCILISKKIVIVGCCWLLFIACSILIVVFIIDTNRNNLFLLLNYTFKQSLRFLLLPFAVRMHISSLVVHIQQEHRRRQHIKSNICRISIIRSNFTFLNKMFHTRTCSIT